MEKKALITTGIWNIKCFELEQKQSGCKRSEMCIRDRLNGKVRAKFDISADAGKEEIEQYVRGEFAGLWEGKEIVKLIVVPGRIVNIVVK